MIIAKQPPLGPFGWPVLAPFPFDRAETLLTRNGRTAIWLGLRALGLAPKARILVPAWHCGSEIDAILAAGAIPVLYGLDRDLMVDPDRIDRLLGQHKAAAVYVIDYFGRAQPLQALRPVAMRHGVPLIEDLALSLYSNDLQGAPLGQQADMAVFSLVKSIATPDGGALWLKNPPKGALPKLAPPPLRASLPALKALLMNHNRKAIHDGLADQDQQARDAWDNHAGFTAPDDPQAASRISKAILRLTDHRGLALSRRSTYRALQAAVPDLPHLHPLIAHLPAEACPAYFPLWVKQPEKLVEAMFQAGIEPVRFWRRFHPAFDLHDFPFEQALKRHVIRLPLHRLVNEDAVARIANACATCV